MSENNTHTAEQLALMRTLPANILAEQMLLGAMLTNNEVYHRVSDLLQADHFYEPVHRRIFEAISICKSRLLSTILNCLLFLPSTVKCCL